MALTISNSTMNEFINSELEQNLNVINDRMGGTVELGSDYIQGTKREMNILDLTASSFADRDVTDTAPETPKQAGNLKQSMIRFPVAIEKIEFGITNVNRYKDGDPEALVGGALARHYAQQMQFGMVNTTIAALKGALLSGGLVPTLDGSSTLNTSLIDILISGFGDKAQNLVSLVTNSIQSGHLTQNALNSNSETLLNNAALQLGNIYEGMALTRTRRMYVTDSDNLTLAGTPDVHLAMALATGAIRVVEIEGARFFNLDEDTTSRNAKYVAHYETELGIEVNGYDFTASTDSVSTADLINAANWNLTKALKNSAGVVGKFALA